MALFVVVAALLVAQQARADDDTTCPVMRMVNSVRSGISDLKDRAESAIMHHMEKDAVDAAVPG